MLGVEIAWSSQGSLPSGLEKVKDEEILSSKQVRYIQGAQDYRASSSLKASSSVSASNVRTFNIPSGTLEPVHGNHVSLSYNQYSYH